MSSSENTFQINDKGIGKGFPTYFIADIAANHDGDGVCVTSVGELHKKLRDVFRGSGLLNVICCCHASIVLPHRR